MAAVKEHDRTNQPVKTAGAWHWRRAADREVRLHDRV